MTFVEPSQIRQYIIKFVAPTECHIEASVFCTLNGRFECSPFLKKKSLFINLIIYFNFKTKKLLLGYLTVLKTCRKKCHIFINSMSQKRVIFVSSK